MLTSKFEDLLTFLENKRVLILTHEPIDVDGLASGFLLKFLIEHFGHRDVKLYFSEFNRISKVLIERIAKRFPEYDFNFVEECNLEEIDIALVVDTNNLAMIKSLKISDTNHIFIDHHTLDIQNNSKNLSSLNIIIENFSSAVEIIYEFFLVQRIDLPLPLRWLIISGILTDSGFFKHANNNTLIRSASLLSDDMNIQDVYSALKIEEDYSEKMARIKGLQRLSIIQENDILIGISTVSNFESMLANTLIAMGFDISIVISKKKKEPIITMRARKDLATKIGLHLGKLMQETAMTLNASAGGHEGAASMSRIKDTKLAQEQLLKRIRQLINGQL